MKKSAFVFVFVIAFAGNALAQGCFDQAKEVKPMFSDAVAKAYEENLTAAREAYEKNSNDPDALIWLGRRTAYLGEYKEAVRLFSDGIGKFPGDARFYRHRGHRYITLRCFDDAIRDLEHASRMMQYRPDEIEPDGLPNARNIPTSTLKTNIYYHLGLAYYLKGRFKPAMGEFFKCLNTAETADMKVAAVHWIYMGARRKKMKGAAERIIFLAAPEGLDIIENHDYYKMAKLYQNRLTDADILEDMKDGGLSNATLGYGLGNWYFYNGNRAKAREIFRQITSGDQWASFGYIAAEAELSR